jgi:hypothetical protein
MEVDLSVHFSSPSCLLGFRGTLRKSSSSSTGFKSQRAYSMMPGLGTKRCWGVFWEQATEDSGPDEPGCPNKGEFQTGLPRISVDEKDECSKISG